MSEQNPWTNQQPDDFSDFDNYGEQFKPKHAFRAGLDTLSNGDYDFEITDAALDRTTNGTRICRLGLKTSQGRQVESTYWLNKQQEFNKFGADVALLGFPSEKWGQPGHPLSKVIPETVAKLQGLKFRATKSSRQDSRPGNTTMYHELHIACRLDGRPMPPLTPPVNGQGVGASPKQAETAGPSGDIPF